MIVNYSNSQRAGVILYLTALIFGAYLDPATLPPKPVSANEVKGVLIAVKQASDNAAILFILLLILNTIALSSYY